MLIYLWRERSRLNQESSLDRGVLPEKTFYSRFSGRKRVKSDAQSPLSDTVCRTRKKASNDVDAKRRDR